MRLGRLNVFTVLAGLTVVLLLSAGPANQADQADPTDQAAPRWEYGTYEVIEQTTGRLHRTIRWLTRERVVSADEDKFRLFMKLGIHCTKDTAHELMLWNHLGEEGWEFVTHQSASTRKVDRTMTVFRRLRK